MTLSSIYQINYSSISTEVQSSRGISDQN